mmetsp:Transcript_123007/g.309589  ORF Transcript_123007/g.309589 Transcript_123007/m.309589 type:complete len:91 (+) Transcript_123007:84-356(+)
MATGARVLPKASRDKLERERGLGLATKTIASKSDIIEKEAGELAQAGNLKGALAKYFECQAEGGNVAHKIKNLSSFLPYEHLLVKAGGRR